MLEQLTDRARKVISLAEQAARRYNHLQIDTDHILLGLVEEGSGVAAHALKNLGADAQAIRMEIERIVPTEPEAKTVGILPFTPRIKTILEYAMEECRRLDHNYVGTEHLLLGLVREPEGAAARALANLGMKPEEIRNEVLSILGHFPAADGAPAPHLKMEQLATLLQRAFDECRDLASDTVGGGHVLLALLRMNEPIVEQALASFGIKSEDLRNELIRLLQAPPK